MKKIVSLLLISTLLLSFTAFAAVIDIENLTAVKRNIDNGDDDDVDNDRVSYKTVDVDEITAANGSLYGWTMDVKNNAETATNVTVVLALYDSNNLLKDITTTIKTVSAGATVPISMSTTIPALTDTSVAYSGGKVKLFVWNNFTDKSPFIGAETYNIQ